MDIRGIGNLSSKHTTPRPAAGTAAPGDQEQAYPLSYGQRALWFFHQLEPENAAYNVVHAARLHTEIDLAAARHALQALVDRHPMLRTTFSQRGGEPFQVIHPHQEVCFEIYDAGAWDDAQIDRRLEEEVFRPFDLERGPLFRAIMLSRSRASHIALFSLHHIITDLWSLALLLYEFGELYRSEISGEPAHLKPPRSTYVEHVIQENDRLSGPEGEELRTYWKGQLGGRLPVLDLPTDFPRPAVQRSRGAVEIARFDPDATARLKAFSAQNGVSIQATVLAAFQVLLGRLTGQEDILLGFIKARRSAEMARVAGYFVNPIVLRADLSENPSFLSFLHTVDRSLAAGSEHDSYPFSLLVQDLEIERDLSRIPAAQVLFSWQKTTRLVDSRRFGSLALGKEGLAVSFAGLSLEPYPLPYRVVPNDLTLYMAEAEDELFATLEYNAGLFLPSTARRVLGHLQTLLANLPSGAGTPIFDLPYLTPAERQQILVEWNQTCVRTPQDDCIHVLVEAQAKEKPSAPAVTFEDESTGQTLTYAELNRRANQVAHFLRKKGIGRETLVGIYLDRSPEMIVGALGILKSGAAYVPIDPAFPKERVSFILKDTRMHAILTQQKRAAPLAAQTPNVFCLDSDWSQIALESEENPVGGAEPGNRAYVIYTSGSTGQPKGVQITHQGVVNVLMSMGERPGLCSQDILLAVTTLSFDISVLEIFLPLATGAQVVLASQEAAHDGRRLSQLLQVTGATIMQATPATWRMLIEAGWQGDRRIKALCGGEALPVDLAEALLERAGELWNLYGPTETTIWSTACRIETASLPISVGRPIANTQVYILQKYDQPAPIGVVGELCIGGAGLARGYLNRPELTGEKFAPVPAGLRSFSDQDGQRIYRTGDLARYLPDGCIEILGRIDQQVKIRGFRIEPGEIEAALAGHPAIREAVVVAREQAGGGKQLAAYCVPSSHPAPTAQELRRFLQDRLPAYMLPSTFTLVPGIPCLPNGKADRRTLAALPAPGIRTSGSPAGYAAPRTPVEEALFDIWSEVLGLDRVGIYDNFFEIGGHSLLATQIASRLRNLFPVELPLRLLFEAPTIASLAEQVENLLRKSPAVEYPPIQPAGGQGPRPLSFAQERIWFVHQLDPGTTAYNIASAWRLEGPLDLDALQKTVDELVHRHASLRTRFTLLDGQPVQIVEESLPYPVPVIDLTGLPVSEREARAQLLADEVSRVTFDLSRCPLFRITLIRLAQDTHILAVNIHHVISDAWSGGVIARDIQALYLAYSGAEAVELPELPVQVADFAVWQRQWLTGQVLEEHLSFWKEQLAGLQTLSLPIARARPAVQSYQGDYLKFKLAPDLMNSLKRLSQQEGATLFMTFLATFNLLLQRYTTQEDIAVGSFIANRKWQPIENLVGTFVNTLVLRTDLSGDPAFREVIRRVRQVSLDAFAHQDMPFEKLVAELGTERDLSRSPIVQVMFNLINVPFQSIQLPGIQCTPVDVHRGGAQFDLLLTVVDTALVQEAAIEYNSRLCAAEDIQRLAGHFELLLREVAADPEKRISEFSLLSEAERRQILEEWNATGVEYPFETTLQAMFEAQVERTPDALAVIDEEETLTFRELNQRANRLAHDLLSRGVGPETLVGVSIERSAAMYVCLLGILKAGAAYVPLDPAYPKERLAFIIRDAALPFIVTQHKFSHELRAYGAEIVCLEQLEQASPRPGDGARENNPPGVGNAGSLAYVIYTSGSTGTPKGVLGVQRGALNRFHWMWDAYPFQPGEVACQKTALNFVDSVWEIFGPLLQGVPTLVAPDLVVRDPARLVELLAQQRVSRIVLVPSLLQALLDVSDDLEQRLPGLKLWVCSGEALPLGLAQRFHQQMPGRTLLNLYGSSEVAADSTWYETRPNEPAATVPIGRPVSNTRLYVLDPRRHPVPVGVPGELYIGGAGLARGYLNRAELTAERFIPNPVARGVDGVLYKTGDLVRFLPDGNLEYLGRIDHQVKIRGIRIELGEIEFALKQHPAVEGAVISAIQSESGDRRLAAYVVLKPHGECSRDDLWGYLKTRLPEPMVPGIYIFLDSLPLTPNGKIDRRALPAPDFSQAARHVELVTPRSTLEKELLGIWEAVLGVRPLGIRDNFFELGGHSLLALQLFARIEKSMGAQLPPVTIFQAPTVELLARQLHLRETAAKATNIIPIKKSGTLPPLFLVHGLGGGIVDYGDLAHQICPDLPVYGIQDLGLDEKEDIHLSIEEMAERYIQAIRSIQPDGPYYLGGYCFGGVVAYEIASQLETQGIETALLAILEGYAPVVVDSKQQRRLSNLKGFLLNFPYWLRDFVRLERAKKKTRILRLFRSLLQSVVFLVYRPDRIDLRDFVDQDIEQIPEIHRRIMESHLRAQRTYVPQKISGRITLFRVRGLSPFRSYDSTMGWSSLTETGVDVHMIEGAHFNILMKPQVDALAEKLRASLECARSGRR